MAACQEAGGQPGQWRTAEFCPAVDCTPAGREWRECGSGQSPKCGSVGEVEEEGVGQGAGQGAGQFCIAGCYCPWGLRLHNDRPVEFKMICFIT